MSELILSLVPLAIAASIQPPQVIALVVLMQTKQGASNGWAYVVGMAAFRLAFGAIFWFAISTVEQTIEVSGDRFEIFVGAVLTVLGLLLLVSALRQGTSASIQDEPAVSWMEKLQTVKPMQAAWVGIAFLALDPKDWLVDISAIDLIAAADLGGWESLLTYFVYILLAQLVLLIPLIMALVNPQKAQESLERLKVWLEKHERTVMVLFSILLGCLFIYSGLAHLGII